MRALIVCMLLLSHAAFAAPPNVIVFRHECGAIDPAKTGLHCGIAEGRMRLHWVKAPTQMTAAERETAKYTYSHIIMRYFDLGGRQFDVTGAHWTLGMKKECTIRPSRALFCVSFKCNANGQNCESTEKF